MENYCLYLPLLPQGTPISPLLTNLIMIPFDFRISKLLYSGTIDKRRYFYTRYADDISISCVYDFNPKLIEKTVLEVIKTLGAPFELNTKKTHYASYAGHNFHLGLMYNAERKITVGYKKKDMVKAMLTNFALDNKNGKEWSLHEVQELHGLYNYCRQQEPDYFEHALEHLSTKFKIDIENEMLRYLKGVTA